MISLKDKLFKTKEGRYVYGQRPNLPANLAVLFVILAVIFRNETRFFTIVAGVFALTWAFLEIFSGVNLFRKLYGFIVTLIILLVLYTVLQ